MSLTIDMYDAILSEQVFCQQKQNQIILKLHFFHLDYQDDYPGLFKIFLLFKIKQLQKDFILKRCSFIKSLNVLKRRS